jgi:hypothetical protein
MDVFETIKQTVWTGSSIPARTNDPILNLASQWGFDVTLYEPKSAPWEQFFTLFVHNQIFIGVSIGGFGNPFHVVGLRRLQNRC